MAEVALRVEGLSVAYGRVAAVRDISFEVPAGALVTLVGANGAGKTSVLGALSGIVPTAVGRVEFHGDTVTRWPAHKRVRAGLVQVPEGRAILATLTVEENLRLGAWHHRRTAAADIAAMYGRFPVLAQRRALPAGSLSGGEQQLLAIARALVARPKVLLMDEPSMGLAPRAVDEVFAVIAQIRASGTTVVLVEQNARRALAAADHCYVMEVGAITHHGPGPALLADPRVVDAYLGR